MRIGNRVSWALAVLLAACVSGARAQEAGGAANAPEQPAEPGGVGEDLTRERLEAHNLELALPTGRWTRVNVQANHPAAGSAQWTRGNGYNLAVRTEPMSSGSPEDADAWVDMLCLNLASQAASVTLVECKPETVAGLDGRRYKIDLKTKADSQRVEGWAAVAKGLCYRVTVSAKRSQAITITGELNRILPGVTRIDPARSSNVTRARVVSPVDAASLGIRVVLPEGGRFEDAAGATQEVGAEAIVLAEGAWTFFVASNIQLGALTATDEELLEAIQAIYALRTKTEQADGAAAQEAKPVWRKQDLGQGVRKWTGSFDRGENAWPLRFRVAVVFRGSVVTIARAWTGRPSHEATIVNDLIEKLELLPLGPGAAEPRPVADLTPTDRTIHGVLMGTVAHTRNDAGDGAGALPWFVKAAEYNPSDVAMVDRAVAIMEELGRIRDAVKLLDTAAMPTDPKQAAARLVVEGRLRGVVGDLAGSDAAYQKFFATGRRDDEVLGSFLESLDSQGKHEEIVRAIDEWAAANPETFLSRRARAVARGGKVDEGVALLRVATEAKPTNWESVWAYLDLLLEFDRNSDVLESCDRFLKDEPTSAALLVRKGRAEMGLGWFGKARASFEAGLVSLPGNKTLLEDLAGATRALGQGDRTLIVPLIDPVAAPEDLTRAMPGASGGVLDIEGAPMVTELDLTAIGFETGKPLRTTRTLRQRAQNRAGVDWLSTKKFSFNRGRERVCVNSFRVLDPSGKATGMDPSTFYVTDAEAGQASEDKMLVLPASGLTVGSTLEVVVTFETLASLDRFDHDSSRFLVYSPTVRRMLWIQTAVPPKDVAIWKTLGNLKIDERDRGVAFIADNLPAHRSEPSAARAIDWDRFVIYGPRGRTWDSLGREYLEEIKTCHDAGPPAQAAKEAEALADPSLPLAERVQRIAALVQRTLTYRAVAFGPRAYIPRTPEEPYRDRSGDCKDHSILLRSLLRHIGIPAHLALYSFGIPPTAEIADRNAFDHMIVYVPGLVAEGGGGTFLDTTSDDLDASLLGHSAAPGTLALVLDPAGPSLVEVPFRDARREGSHVTRDVLVLADGTARVEERIESFGRDSTGYKERFAAMAPAERTEWAANMFSERGRPAVIRSVTFEGHDVIGGGSDDRGVVAKVSYEIPGAFRREGNTLAGILPMEMEHSRVPFDRVASRVSPLRFIRWSFTSETTIRTEPPSTPGTLPAAFALRVAAGDGAVEWTMLEATADKPGPSIVRRVRFEDVPGLHEPAAWNTYADLSQQVLAESERSVTFSLAAEAATPPK